jgi:hypothetical protein
MFIGDVAQTNIRSYIHQFHITDEHIGERGSDLGAQYIRRLTNEYIGPRASHRLTRDPYIRRLTDKYNLYMHELTDKFRFFDHCMFWVPPRTGSLHNRHYSTQFLNI